MRNCLTHAVVVSSIVLCVGCDRPTPSEPGAYHPDLMAMGPGPTGGALVANSGEGQDDAVCFFGSFTATRASGVRSPSGNATLSCHFEGLAPIPAIEIQTGWPCIIIHGGTSETTNTQWVRSTSGTAEMKCQFSGKPTYNSAVLFGAEAAPAQEGNWTTSLSDLPGQARSAPIVDIGRGCNGDPLAGDPAGAIALVERGACAFSDKVANAFNAGAVGAVVYNSAAGGEQIITMSGAVTVPIPAVFVARSTGQALQASAPATVTLKGCARSATCRGSL